MKLFLKKAINKIKNIEHSIYLNRKRKKLKHINPTIISNNCVGGVISHDLGQRFCSPTVNLYFRAADYIKFIKNLRYYLSLDPEMEETDLSYPVGRLDDIKVYFMHYHSFDEARQKWNERKRRIDYENLYFIMTEKEGCTRDILEEFDSLDYKNKVALTHIDYPAIRCAHYMRGFDSKAEMGIITDPKPTFWQRRYIDDFDYVSFLNQ